MRISLTPENNPQRIKKISVFFKPVELVAESNIKNNVKEIKAELKKASISLLRAKAGSKLEYKYRLLIEKPFFALMVPLTSVVGANVVATNQMLVAANDLRKFLASVTNAKSLESNLVAKFPAVLYAPQSFEDLILLLDRTKKDMICSIVKLNNMVLKGSELLVNGLCMVAYTSLYDLLQNLFLTPGYFASNLVEVAFED